MRTLILCLERLYRICQILRRVGGEASLRDYMAFMGNPRLGKPDLKCGWVRF